MSGKTGSDMSYQCDVMSFATPDDPLGQKRVVRLVIQGGNLPGPLVSLFNAGNARQLGRMLLTAADMLDMAEPPAGHA